MNDEPSIVHVCRDGERIVVEVFGNKAFLTPDQALTLAEKIKKYAQKEEQQRRLVTVVPRGQTS